MNDLRNDLSRLWSLESNYVAIGNASFIFLSLRHGIKKNKVQVEEKNEMQVE